MGSWLEFRYRMRMMHCRDVALQHPQVLLRLIVIKGDAEVLHEEQNLLPLRFQPASQLPARRHDRAVRFREGTPFFFSLTPGIQSLCCSTGRPSFDAPPDELRVIDPVP